MEEIAQPVKKPSGCLRFFGWLLTIGSVLFILFNILMIIEGEKHMDELRDEYSAAEQEYEEAMEAYNTDSVHLQAEYQRIQSLIEKADEAGDSTLVAELSDSLAKYAEPEFHSRGAIGFNIGGAFFLSSPSVPLSPWLPALRSSSIVVTVSSSTSGIWKTGLAKVIPPLTV